MTTVFSLLYLFPQNPPIMKKIVLLIFAIDLSLELLLQYFDFVGDSDKQHLQKVLQYFTNQDILNGKEYSQAGFGISIVSLLLTNFLGIYLVLGKLSFAIEDFANRIARSNKLVRNFLYFFFYVVITTLLQLPFSFYFGYTLEHQFGFSNLTVGLWFWKKAKQFLVTIVLGGISVLFTLWVIEKIKVWWVFVVPIAGLVFGLFMTIVYPYTILPIFYESAPIENGSLKTKILALAEHSQIPVSDIYVIQESQYSNHTNAFFIGFGKYKRIYLYDTLIKTNTEGEILSVLAHEIGHWVHNDMIWGILFSFLTSLFTFICLYLILVQFQKGKLIRELHSPSSIPAFLFVFGILGTFLGPLDNWVGRDQESLADYTALVLTDDSKSFISSEVKLAKQNKSRLDEHPFVIALRHSHPPTMQRIQMAEEYEKFLQGKR